MPKLDQYHGPVKQALIKDGWTITDDPFTMKFGKMRLFADLGAEKVIAAEKSGRRIVVEIKVFGGPSPVADLEQALGQYGLYRTVLKHSGEDRELILAVAKDVYDDLFRQTAVQLVVSDHQLKLLVFEPDQAEIVQWIQ